MAVKNPYIWGLGRRKTASARVRIKAGTGKFLVNGLEFEKFFLTHDTRRAAAMPLTVTDTRNNYDIWCNVIGGGVTGQAGAVSLGIVLVQGCVPNQHRFRCVVAPNACQFCFVRCFGRNFAEQIQNTNVF